MIQYISKPFKYFFKLESASGLVLLFAAVIALFISNSSLGENYFKILESAGAGNLLICTVIIPPSAILLNSLFLNQAVSQSELIGLLIILVGLIVLDGRYIKSSKRL